MDVLDRAGEAALYPIAGAAGVVGAALGYLLARAVGGGHDVTQEWAWTGCFLGVIALMRAEMLYEAGHSSYRSLRHALRLVFGFLFMTYFGIHSSPVCGSVYEKRSRGHALGDTGVRLARRN